MRKWIILIMGVLLLAGCSQKGGADTSHVTTYPGNTEATLPKLYQPDSQIEQDTAGAVRAYTLSDPVLDICQAGGGVGLIEEASLTVIQGENGSVTGTYDRTESLICTTDGAVLGYDPENFTLSYLGSSANAAQGWKLPEETEGTPLVSRIKGEIYYCIPGQVLALDMQTGITRRILEHTQSSLSLVNLCFDDTVLCLETEEGARYIRVENGQSVCNDTGLLSLTTVDDTYLAKYREGSRELLIFGTGEGTACQLLAEDENAILTAEGIVSWNEEGLLSFYDLQIGNKATVAFPETPVKVAAEDACVWVLTEKTLYRWDPALSQDREEADYSTPMYTAQAPDTEGLAQCQERVDQLNKTYGIKIAIWEDALEQPGDYILTGEYQVPELQSLLDQLEPLLAQFPDRFLRSTVEAGWVRVSLVRAIGSGEPFVQYWAAGDCYIVLTSGCDVEEAFYTGLGWGVDSHILGNSRDLEYWNDLNPKGFDYDYDYESNAQREDTYISEGPRFFVDKRAMSFPTEDRARTFYYAMMPGNESVFEIPAIQKKLRLLCEGIREAYGLKKYAEALPWETYLAEPLYS